MKPKIDAAQAVQLYEQGLTHDEIAVRFDATEASVRRALARAEREGWVRPRLRSLTEITLEQPLEHNLDDGSIAVTADFHFPITDYGLVNQFLYEADKLGVRTLGVAGDWWHQDAWSRFDAKQDSAGARLELQAGNAAMTRILQQFDKVLFSWGNHDARVHKMLGYKVDFVTAMKMVFYDVPDELLDKIEFSNLDHFIVRDTTDSDEERGDWFVCHPKTYSRRPLVTAMELAAIKHMNIACAHSHHHAYGWDRSGKFRLVEVGGFFDRSRTEYLQRTDIYPHWTNGYMFITQDNDAVLRGRGISLL